MREQLTIAVATLSGFVYYEFAKELKRRNIYFISLNPNSEVPIHVNLVLTTKEEQHLLDHQNVVTYDDSTDIAEVVDQALWTAHGTLKTRRLVIGIDPGKSWGLSAIADERLLQSSRYMSMSEVENQIQRLIGNVKAEKYVVKVGNGSEPFHSQLIFKLDGLLPEDTIIESVREEGTSSDVIRGHSRQIDALSAEQICFRRGKRIRRRGGTDRTVIP